MVWKAIVTCLVIILGKIVEVSLNTLKTMMTVKGKALISSIVGFVEAIIWFLVVRSAITGDGEVWILISYAFGYAVGIYVGNWLSKVLIKGLVQVQVITGSRDDSVVEKIREQGYGVTVIDVNSSNHSEEKYMLFVEIASNKLNKFKTLIKELDDKAFIMVSETKQVVNGYFTNRISNTTVV